MGNKYGVLLNLVRSLNLSNESFYVKVGPILVAELCSLYVQCLVDQETPRRGKM